MPTSGDCGVRDSRGPKSARMHAQRRASLQTPATPRALEASRGGSERSPVMVGNTEVLPLEPQSPQPLHLCLNNREGGRRYQHVPHMGRQ